MGVSSAAMTLPSRRNLVLVARRTEPYVMADLRQVATHCRELAPDIRPIPLLDAPRSLFRVLIATHPTLVFATRRLLFYHPLRGTVRTGRLLPKSEEYRRLEAAGIPVPQWRLLTRRNSPAVIDLGRYVVTKPDYGGRGAEVRIRRTSRVRWRPPNTPVRFASRSGVIAQKFIYTGLWPISYRVTTLFGRVLFSLRAEASHERTPIKDPEAFESPAVTANHLGCSFELNNDAEIITFGERLTRLFPISRSLAWTFCARSQAAGFSSSR